MKRTGVSSSNMVSIGYNADKQILEIEFIGGSVYQYYDVPADVHEDMMASDSKGKFLRERVGHQFKYNKIS